jgi:hypothetical protein
MVPIMLVAAVVAAVLDLLAEQAVQVVWAAAARAELTLPARRLLMVPPTLAAAVAARAIPDRLAMAELA